MSRLDSRRFILGLALVVLALPAMAAAQSSTFIVEFNRTGTPGTATVTTTDPLTGQPITMIVDTGAFRNPCTGEYVDVRGTSTISTNQTIDRFGTVKVVVSEVTKGRGAGWVLDALGAPVFTGSAYTFTESQQLTFRLPAAGEEFASDFADKIAMKGAKSIDNWIIRAHFRVKVNADGTVQVFLIKTTADPTCKG
jgi:hypothetical protein